MEIRGVDGWACTMSDRVRGREGYLWGKERKKESRKVKEMLSRSGE